MSDGMGREPAYLSSHATNRYFIPNWGNSILFIFIFLDVTANMTTFALVELFMIWRSKL